nr:1-aminocyclopropane-1-carboxylate oxidase homolog 1-like [Tanacetum cinerariifolium]
MADHSQKWHDDSSNRRTSSVNLDGCRLCRGTHLNKECPLNEEVYGLEEVRYGKFGRSFPNNGGSGASLGITDFNNGREEEKFNPVNKTGFCSRDWFFLCEEEESEEGPCSLSLQVPVINFYGGKRAKIVGEIKEASENWGIFQVIGHGIPFSVLEEMIKGVQGFHEQKKEVKMQCCKLEGLDILLLC